VRRKGWWGFTKTYASSTRDRMGGIKKTPSQCCSGKNEVHLGRGGFFKRKMDRGGGEGKEEAMKEGMSEEKGKGRIRPPGEITKGGGLRAIDLAREKRLVGQEQSRSFERPKRNPLVGNGKKKKSL